MLVNFESSQTFCSNTQVSAVGQENRLFELHSEFSGRNYKRRKKNSGRTQESVYSAVRETCCWGPSTWEFVSPHEAKGGDNGVINQDLFVIMSICRLLPMFSDVALCGS